MHSGRILRDPPFQEYVATREGADLKQLGLNLCHMNRRGQNHGTYHELGEKNQRTRSERREQRRGGSIMDKASREAEKGESNVVERGECTEGGKRECA